MIQIDYAPFRPTFASRVLRWTWRLVAAMSFLLFVSMTVLWIRSHYRCDGVIRSEPNFDTELCSMHGCVVFALWDYGGTNQPGIWFNSVSFTSKFNTDLYVYGSHWWNRQGFVAYWDRPIGPNSLWVYVTVPHWSLCALFAVLTAISLYPSVLRRCVFTILRQQKSARSTAA